LNRCDRIWTAVVCWSLISVSTAIAEDDQVFLLRGGVVRGTVTATSPTQITMTVDNQAQAISVAEIRLVSFGDEPTQLREARSRAVGGKYSQAQQDLQRVTNVESGNANIRNDLNFYRALADARVALTSGGDKSAAAKAMLDFVRSDPNSHHFFEAAEVLGDLAVAQRDHAAAVRYYGSISAKAPWPEYKMRASLLEARALIDQGAMDQAKAKYESVMGMASQTAEAKRMKLFAVIGRSRCQAETGSLDEGIAAIESVIRDNEASDGELFGRAYNALGDCYRAADKPKEALMAYLHVDVLFYADPETHAESLHWIAQLWDQLGKPDRAAAARNLLTTRYAGSRWKEE
jgi:tetratricopeptide (TPR) repeat protein